MPNIARTTPHPAVRTAASASKTKVLLVRQPVKSVRKSDEADRAAFKLAIGVITARGIVGAVWLMGYLGYRFERWFGPFPWYEDGYKLVETPHLGMEHQSAVAYGNHYRNGYLGRDLSHTGHGLKWDFIIIHESAHEWWGNNISMKDAADMWIHESFANYAEAIYTECQEGKTAGAEYARGSRANIQNDRPIIRTFNDVTNPPMIAVNEKAGFRQGQRFYRVRRKPIKAGAE